MYLQRNFYKRSFKMNEKGIEGADDMSGSDLKKVLIEHFGL